MAFAYRINRESGLIVVIGRGKIKEKNMMEHFHALFSEPDLPVPFRNLVSLSKVTRFEIDPQTT